MIRLSAASNEQPIANCYVLTSVHVHSIAIATTANIAVLSLAIIGRPVSVGCLAFVYLVSIGSDVQNSIFKIVFYFENTK